MSPNISDRISSFDFKSKVDLSHLLEAFKSSLKTINALMEKRFAEGEQAELLINEKSRLVDQILTETWGRFINKETLALVAVGGYGRGELHPGSDIDILLLATEEDIEAHKDSIEKFLTFLWDIGMEIGQSVRTVKDCEEQGAHDITVATNLIESRLICGNRNLFEEMLTATSPEKIWSSKEFFEEKLAEQKQRHRKFNDTAYNLEPNIKEGIGGLRDIQMIGWVAKRHFGKSHLSELVELGFLTESEYNDLIDGQNFLWNVRFALHCIGRKHEDRLLFDYQKKIAKQLGYEDTSNMLGVEMFMQKYFRTITQLARLNDMLLQLFEEEILSEGKEEIIKISPRFRCVNGYLETTHKNTFKRYKFGLLEIFLLIIQDERIKGIRANTIRQIRDHRYIIDDAFRNDIRAQSLFMEILRQPSGVSHEIIRMHRYGVLGAYIPEFEMITGRMQYDLFHAFTVDTHTLFVVRYLRRFAVDELSHEFPFCSIISNKLPKPELLYIAGLFHDIAKGRGGDHSELGAVDAYNFCKRHHLSEYDCNLVSWLVRNHLLMSMTAQRKDISQPEVIIEFASNVVDKYHLDYLYLLTVADIRATNGNLWNSWRDALLRELYISTNATLRLGAKGIDSEEQLIEETAKTARKKVLALGVHHMKLKSVFKDVPEEYFLRYTPKEIAWQVQGIAETAEEQLPLVMIESSGFRGGTELFIYSHDRPNMFALVCSVLDQLRLVVIDARIITSNSHKTFDTYLIANEDNEPVTESTRRERIITKIREVINDPKAQPSVSNKHAGRKLKFFHIETVINFKQDENQGHTAIEVFTADKPGLLARIGVAFSKCKLSLKNARIATIGERAEDIFYVTDFENQVITAEEELKKIREMLFKWINSEDEVENSSGIIEIDI
ncbi:MAG: [protein-PII] uridylyltransferase [Gammaproteobacteria bacterium]|nr:MAG: [protein-PII] uridylyltransferase [Gammaproteobacteria bacterium]